MNKNTNIPHHHRESGAADKYDGGIDGAIVISTSDVGCCGWGYIHVHFRHTSGVHVQFPLEQSVMEKLSIVETARISTHVL